LIQQIGLEGSTIGKGMIPTLLESTRDLLYPWRRKIATAAVLLLICTVAYHVVFGANGLMIYSKKRSEYKALQVEVDRLQHDNQELSKEIYNLKTDPKTIEKEAREQLRYARPGEVVFTMPNRPAAPDHTATAQNH
jgi:cell division protein FtsB